MWPSESCCLIRRDREEAETAAREAEEREALKGMTDAERRAWEAAHPKARCPPLHIRYDLWP